MAEIPTLFLSTPNRPPSTSPYLDRLTLRVASAWQLRTKESIEYRASVRVCTCGALPVIGNTYIIGKKSAPMRVDALCVHHVAYHRSELVAREVDLLARLEDSEMLPTQEELRDPPTVHRLSPRGAWNGR